MTRTILTTAFALLFMLTTATAGSVHRGPGCWRTHTARQKAAARLATQKPTDSDILTNYRGKKKGLVILCEFTNKKFASGHDHEKYNNILNPPGYTTSEGFLGSVADYFRDQSAGLFELNFDVVGPLAYSMAFRHSSIQGCMLS